MLTRHEVQVLLKAGVPQAKIAELSGASLRSIRRIEKEAPVVHVDTSKERRARRVGRPGKAEPFRAFVAELFAKEGESDLLSVEVLRRAKLAGYTGQKTALYELIAEVRPRNVRPIVRFEGVAGEFTQHDFGHVDVRFLDSTERRVHFFASRLKYSRFACVSLVPDERAETLVRRLVDHFERMGGIPLLAVFDRPKTVALRWGRDGKVTEWNPTFAGVALDLGLGIELCWPHSPEQKGAIENLVGWVKGSFFKQRRFVDDEDLGRQLAEWHEEVNTQRPSRATGVVPAERMKEERARLRPLKVKPDDLALRFPMVVGPTGNVVHDDHPYSMPPDSIGFSATLFLYKDRVRIVAGRFEAVHERKFLPGEKSVLPAHRAQMVAAVSGKRAKRYYKREQLLQLGPVALDYLTEIIHRRPSTWMADVDQLFALLEQRGDDALRDAMTRALAASVFGAEYVAHYLAESAAASPSAPAPTAPVQQELPL